jgi:hypothetical protein
VGELGKNLSPLKLWRYQDSDEFMRTGRKEPSEVFAFVISKKFANLPLLGEMIAERA